MSALLRTLGAPSAVAARAFSTSARRDIARITIIGNLAGTPELKETPNGRTIIRYSVASSSGPHDNRHTSWFRVASSAEGRFRDFMLSVPKGSTVFVEGNALVDSWTTPEGQQRTGLKIWQTGFEVIKKKQPTEEASEHAEAEGEHEYGQH